MEFHVTPLRSGSSGNLTLLEHAGTTLLVDAGLPSQRGLADALAEAQTVAATLQRVGYMHFPPLPLEVIENARKLEAA